MRRVFRGARVCVAAGIFVSLATWSGCAATGHPEPDAAERRESAALVDEDGPSMSSEAAAALLDDESLGGAVCVTEDGAPFESESC
ncbi:hypothetical protein [Sorangium sp. So ce1099]|uniref:hypothetical protein n=1 Tax=Sorangium sp. So ce1099 TaxID=3133331 RepID=UPI003F648F0F